MCLQGQRTEKESVLCALSLTQDNSLEMKDFWGKRTAAVWCVNTSILKVLLLLKAIKTTKDTLQLADQDSHANQLRGFDKSGYEIVC